MHNQKSNTSRAYFAGLFGFALLLSLLSFTRSEQLLEYTMELEPSPLSARIVQWAGAWDDAMERIGVKPALKFFRD